MTRNELVTRMKEKKRRDGRKLVVIRTNLVEKARQEIIRWQPAPH